MVTARFSHADDSAAARIAAARALGTEALILADQSNCKDAIPKLERADKLFHAPTIAGRLGECYIAVGRLVAGTELLQRLLHEPVLPNAPPAFVAATARATKTLDAALPRIPSLRVTVHAPPGIAPTVLIDGDPYSDSFFDVERPTDPGSHTLTVSAEGCLPSSATVTLSEGKTSTVDLKLEADPRAPRAVRVASSAVAKPRQNAVRPSALGPVLVVGTGGALLLSAGITGIIALNKTGDIADRCKNDVCPRGFDLDSNRSSARTFVGVTDLLLAIGGVAVLGGLYWGYRVATASPEPGNVVPPSKTARGWFSDWRLAL